MKMKYLKLAVLCFLSVPLVANDNKYTLRGKNTKAEVIAQGLEVRNASQDRGVNQINAKAKFQTYEINTANFKPCQPDKVGIIIFMPPKGIIFSGELKEFYSGHFKFLIRSGEEDSVLVSVECGAGKGYSFPLVE